MAAPVHLCPVARETRIVYSRICSNDARRTAAMVQQTSTGLLTRVPLKFAPAFWISGRTLCPVTQAALAADETVRTTFFQLTAPPSAAPALFSDAPAAARLFAAAAASIATTATHQPHLPVQPTTCAAVPPLPLLHHYLPFRAALLLPPLSHISRERVWRKSIARACASPPQALEYTTSRGTAPHITRIRCTSETSVPCCSHTTRQYLMASPSHLPHHRTTTPPTLRTAPTPGPSPHSPTPPHKP